jgi:hypothetical protein
MYGLIAPPYAFILFFTGVVYGFALKVGLGLKEGVGFSSDV